MANTINLPETGFLREYQIVGRPGVSEEEAAKNRRLLADALAHGNEAAIRQARARIMRPRKAVPALLPISRASLWRFVRTGKIPAPVKLGERTTAWRVEDIRAVLAQFEQ